jgi:hypothetical protein
MLRRPEMPDGVLVLGRVATADVTALHAHSELLPHIAQSDAIVATRPARLHVSNAIDMRTPRCTFGLLHHEWKLTIPILTANRLLV